MNAHVSLSAPVHGWSTLSVDGLEYHLSYLTDIPMDWTAQLADAINGRRPTALYADLEGEELYLVLHSAFAAAVTDGDGVSADVLRTDVVAFANDVLAAFRGHVDAWAAWDPDMEFAGPDGIAERKTALLQRLDGLEQAIRHADGTRTDCVPPGAGI